MCLAQIKSVYDFCSMILQYFVRCLFIKIEGETLLGKFMVCFSSVTVLY